jgi:hypothetical protein
VRRGQKAAGLSFCSKMAELPKDKTFGGSATLLAGGLRESRTLTTNIRGPGVIMIGVIDLLESSSEASRLFVREIHFSGISCY